MVITQYFWERNGFSVKVDVAFLAHMHFKNLWQDLGRAIGNTAENQIWCTPNTSAELGLHELKLN
jgi:hypothetical protein